MLPCARLKSILNTHCQRAFQTATIGLDEQMLQRLAMFHIVVMPQNTQNIRLLKCFSKFDLLTCSNHTLTQLLALINKDLLHT